MGGSFLHQNKAKGPSDVGNVFTNLFGMLWDMLSTGFSIVSNWGKAVWNKVSGNTSPTDSMHLALDNPRTRTPEQPSSGLGDLGGLLSPLQGQQSGRGGSWFR